MSSQITNSASSTYTLLTLGVMQSFFGVVTSLFVILACKLYPSLSLRAPEYRRIAQATVSRARSWRSSVSTVATETADITSDSVSTLVEPEVIKRILITTSASLGEPFVKLVQTTKKEIRPLARRMSDAVSSPFTTSTTSPFSPASDSYFPRVTTMQMKTVLKKARRGEADMTLFVAEEFVPESLPLVKKLCSLVPEECITMEETNVESELVHTEELALKKKTFRPAKTGKKIVRACRKVLS